MHNERKILYVIHANQAQLPSYQSINDRLNQMGWQFEVVAQGLMTILRDWPALADVRLTDPLPIISASGPTRLGWPAKSPTKGTVLPNNSTITGSNYTWSVLIGWEPCLYPNVSSSANPLSTT